jgi:hypothetical protein
VKAKFGPLEKRINVDAVFQNSRVHPLWSQKKLRNFGRVERRSIWRETKKIQIKLATTCNKNERATGCQKIMLNCRPNGRGRLGRLLKGLSDEAETSLSRTNWWRIIIIIIINFCLLIPSFNDQTCVPDMKVLREGRLRVHIRWYWISGLFLYSLFNYQCISPSSETKELTNSKALKFQSGNMDPLPFTYHCILCPIPIKFEPTCDSRQISIASILILSSNLCLCLPCNPLPSYLQRITNKCTMFFFTVVPCILIQSKSFLYQMMHNRVALKEY